MKLRKNVDASGVLHLRMVLALPPTVQRISSLGRRLADGKPKLHSLQLLPIGLCVTTSELGY